MKQISLSPEGLHEGSLILVNRDTPWVTGTPYLAPVGEGPQTVPMEYSAANILANLIEALGGWNGIAPVSGWRSKGEQEEIYRETLETQGRSYTEKYVALPGHSEHQTGLAVDLGFGFGEIDFICPHFPYDGFCRVFRETALKYGFVERYPRGKEHITGIAHEPWHFRYVGAPHGEIMFRNGLVLEEYLDVLKGYSYRENPLIYSQGQWDIMISYVSGTETVEVGENSLYSLSGDNREGYILTERRRRDG